MIVERGETEGRTDYNFRLGGQTKFFVEAKAPSEPLDAAKHMIQAKGYAWNTWQVFFVILTDFEEFRFYDIAGDVTPDFEKIISGLGGELIAGHALCCSASQARFFSSIWART